MIGDLEAYIEDHAPRCFLSSSSTINLHSFDQIVIFDLSFQSPHSFQHHQPNLSPWKTKETSNRQNAIQHLRPCSRRHGIRCSSRRVSNYFIFIATVLPYWQSIQGSPQSTLALPLLHHLPPLVLLPPQLRRSLPLVFLLLLHQLDPQSPMPLEPHQSTAFQLSV